MSNTITIEVKCPDLIAAVTALATLFQGKAALPVPPVAETNPPIAPPPPAGQPLAPATASPASTTAYHSEPQQLPAALPTTAPTYTLEQIMEATRLFAQAGDQQRNAALGVLQKFGVAGMADLREDQCSAFALEMRALGAQI